MNPELRRNLWLELTLRRMILMAVILGLAFFAAALPGGIEYGPSALAEILYYLIVVVWGTRSAASGVVGEIRDRTWDSQRLSSLGASAMTFGKLFGATAYAWFGGLICLVVLLAGTAVHHGLLTAALDALYYVAVGVISQASALLASLIAIRRGQRHSRLDLFVYQVVGLIAALCVYWVWSAADPESALVARAQVVDTVAWWNHTLDARAFLLVLLAAFAAWILVGCYREMRLELMQRNGPLVWLSFLAFIGVYVAGFDTWLSNSGLIPEWGLIAGRIALAAMSFAGLTYATVLLEPKDRVQYRWLVGQLESGRLFAMLSSLQAWMMSYVATLVAGVVLIGWIGHNVEDALRYQVLIAAGLGFVTRDVALFVLAQSFGGPRRGDLAAVAALVALYGLLPSIFSGLHLDGAAVLFYPQPSAPVWAGAAIAWSEGLIVVALAASRVILRGPVFVAKSA